MNRPQEQLLSIAPVLVLNIFHGRTIGFFMIAQLGADQLVLSQKSQCI